MGVPTEKLILTYTLNVRVHIEQNTPLFMFILTKAMEKKNEKVQKVSAYIILGENAHFDYGSNLEILNLETLEERREKVAQIEHL